MDKVRLPHSSLANSSFHLLLLGTFLWWDFNVRPPFPFLSSHSILAFASSKLN